MPKEPDRQERIATVDAARASGDVLLWVGVPPTESLAAVRVRIERERATVSRLGAATAKPAQGALERARRVLDTYETVPENGLVVYAGVVDGSLTGFVFDDLPDPVRESVFVRSDEFDLGPLRTAADEYDVYGLVVVERGGAALGRYGGGEVTVIDTFESNVPGKHRAGGQSADRFERRRRERTTEFFEAVADAARREFLRPDPVTGLVLGGTEITVERFRDGGYLDARLAECVGGTYAVEYANERGLHELAERAATDGLGSGAGRAREALDRFFAALAHESDPVTYGRDATERALAFDAVETLLLSETLPVETQLDLESRAEREGGESVVVPTGIDRGARFDEAFGGVGALLRFPVE